MKLSGQHLSLEDVSKIAAKVGTQSLSLDSKAKECMQKSYDYLQMKIKKGAIIYGVNTGFGAFSKVKISQDKIKKLQVNLIRSHAVGIGEPLNAEQVRAVLLLRANTLARGTSGVRPEVVLKIIDFLRADILPVIPVQGSVGASGDLAPLAHVALALIGEGECFLEGQRMPTEKALKLKKIKPLELREKEGLSLINGCQVMTAIGLLALAQARQLILLSDFAAAMSIEALRGSRSPFHELVSQNRPHKGEIESARNVRLFLGKTSPIAESHADCDRVQDAYSLRCVPAVHGAAFAAIERAIETLLIEANASTDNPLVFPDADVVLSCGNFHGQPVAAVLDYAALALTSLMSICERRIEKFMNPEFSQLPAFLAPDGGLNSGLMIVHVAAASLVSESKVLSHPASIDSIPTSADKEDHVSMGTIAARKLTKIVEHLRQVIAMEILSAHQAYFFLEPLKPAGVILKVHEYLKKEIPFAKEDRLYAKDVALINNEIESGNLLKIIRANVKGK